MELKGVLTKEERVKELYDLADKTLKEFKKLKKQTDIAVENQIYIIGQFIDLYKQFEDFDEAPFKVIVEDEDDCEFGKEQTKDLVEILKEHGQVKIIN